MFKTLIVEQMKQENAIGLFERAVDTDVIYMIPYSGKLSRE